MLLEIWKRSWRAKTVQNTNKPHKERKNTRNISTVFKNICATIVPWDRTFKINGHRIWKGYHWKCYLTRIGHTLTEEDPGQRIGVWYLTGCVEGTHFPTMIVWSDEATFKLNDSINRNNCLYLGYENPYIIEEYHVNLLVWCSLPSKGLIEPFFFDRIVTEPVYLNRLR